MLLSIVVPVYNCEKKISRCLESLIAVNERDIEFIIVNDGSSDGTTEICQNYEKLDTRIRLINQVNAGVSKARNRGVDFCQGKYVGFVDADDELTENYNEIINTIKEIESDFFAFEYYIQKEKVVEKKERYKFCHGLNEVNVLFESFLSGTLSCVWNNIYKVSIIKDNKILFPDNMNIGEDTEFNANYIQHCHSAFGISSVGYKYYVDNKGNATNASKVSYLNDFVKIYNTFIKIRDLYGKEGFSFYFPYYIDKVYRILTINRKLIKKQEKRNFRESDFYHGLMDYRYKEFKHRLWKLLIRAYIL